MYLLTITFFVFISDIKGSQEDPYGLEDPLICPAADLISPCVCEHSPYNRILCNGSNTIETIQHALANRFSTPIPTLEITNTENLFLPHHSFEDIQVNRLQIVNSSLIMDTAAFSGLDSVKVLELYNNGLTSVPINSLRYIDQIEALSLARNSISHVENFDFSGLHSLKILSLEDNQISDLPSDAFPRSLETLYLSGNQLNTLKGYFDDYPNLRFLYVGRNKFDNIKNMLNMRQLIYLDVAGNHLSSLGDSFQHLPNLEILNLNDNQIGLWLNWFDPLKELKFLFLSKNYLTEIENGVGKLKNLVILDVSENYIQDLTDVYGPLTKLELLILRGNPIRCTDENKEIIAKLQSRNVEVLGFSC